MQHLLHIAPMMGYTHRHFRYLMRKLCPDFLLYTEMITTGALLYGDADRYLAYDVSELPLVLQLGGNDPSALAQCAKMAQERGYSQINLNVGCPSSRVQEGRIGASLYKSLDVVKDCVSAMKQAVDIPVTIKCRIGVDDCDSFDYLLAFAQGVHQAGCDFLVVHARKAWLKGLNPKQNRTVPPLRYDVVSLLAAAISMPVVLNGGLDTLESIYEQLETFPAVMVGRFACAYPLLLAKFQRTGPKDRLPIDQILIDYFSYMDQCVKKGEWSILLLQPLHGFFRGQFGSKQWRQQLTLLQNNMRSGDRLPSDYLAMLLDQDCLSSELAR